MTPEEFRDNTGIPSFIPGYGAEWPDTSKAIGFDLADVTEVVFASEIDGDYGESDCNAIVRTADGWFWFVAAWCDSTGWGCQDGTSVTGPMDATRALHPVTVEQKHRAAKWAEWLRACGRFEVDPGDEPSGPPADRPE